VHNKDKPLKTPRPEIFSGSISFVNSLAKEEMYKSFASAILVGCRDSLFASKLTRDAGLGQ
jgi:hypothetical protein